MKKKQYIRRMFGLGLLGMIALLIFIVPAQSWGGYICDAVLNANGCPDNLFEQDDTQDTDKDGFRNWFECCVQTDQQYQSRPTYYDGSTIPKTAMNPNSPDVYIVLTADADAVTVLDPLKVLKEGLPGINFHPITLDQVGDFSVPDQYRRVSPSSNQRALFLHLSSETQYNFPDNCPIPAEVKIGEGNVGNTMSPNAGGVIWSNQIEAKVKCLYLEAGYDFDLTPPAGEEADWAQQQAKMNNEIIDYIGHTIAHEAGHNLSQRFLEIETDSQDYKTWKKLEYHYKESLDTVMSQYVAGTVRPGLVILNIGTTFEPEDQDSSLVNISSEIVTGSPF